MRRDEIGMHSAHEEFPEFQRRLKQIKDFYRRFPNYIEEPMSAGYYPPGRGEVGTRTCRPTGIFLERRGIRSLPYMDSIPIKKSLNSHSSTQDGT